MKRDQDQVSANKFLCAVFSNTNKQWSSFVYIFLLFFILDVFDPKILILRNDVKLFCVWIAFFSVFSNEWDRCIHQETKRGEFWLNDNQRP